jgi:hypothetical protein
MTTHSTHLLHGHLESRPVTGRRWSVADPALQAFWILRAGFAILPIVAGLDKYFHLLADWNRYLAPSVDRMLKGHGREFMLSAGAIEVIAGLGVALSPRIFAWVVAGWLVGIIVNLLMIPGFYDVALRDVGLVIGAIALARLAAVYTPKP